MLRISKKTSLKFISKEDLDRKKQLTPKINPIFAMFEPIELPIAISGVLLMIEEIVTKTSGIEVPRAITVIPRNMSLKPSLDPNFKVLATNSSAPTTRNTSPPKRVKEFINIYL